MKNMHGYLFLLPLLAVLPATGAEVDFGIQGSVALPTGAFGDADHLDRKPGFGLGIQAPIDFGDGHVLRPRLEYLGFRRNSGEINYKADSYLLMADYNYHVTGDREGVYFLGGLGLHHTRRSVTRPLVGASITGSSSTTGLAYNVGLGYAFSRNAALEVKYLAMHMGALGLGKVARTGLEDSAFAAKGVQVSFSYTF